MKLFLAAICLFLGAIHGHDTMCEVDTDGKSHIAIRGLAGWSSGESVVIKCPTGGGCTASTNTNPTCGIGGDTTVVANIDGGSICLKRFDKPSSGGAGNLALFLSSVGSQLIPIVLGFLLMRVF